MIKLTASRSHSNKILSNNTYNRTNIYIIIYTYYIYNYYIDFLWVRCLRMNLCTMIVLLYEMFSTWFNPFQVVKINHRRWENKKLSSSISLESALMAINAFFFL